MNMSKPLNKRHLRDRLAAWEARNNPTTTLTDKQKETVIDLTSKVSYRIIPSDLPEDDFQNPLSKKQTGDTSTTAEQQESLSQFFQKSGLSEKTETAQMFLSWYSEIEYAMDKEEEISYRYYIEDLQSYKQQCDAVLGEVTSALDYLEGLKQQYISVSTKTNALHEACEHLLDEQVNYRLQTFGSGSAIEAVQLQDKREKTGIKVTQKKPVTEENKENKEKEQKQTRATEKKANLLFKSVTSSPYQNRRPLVSVTLRQTIDDDISDLIETRLMNTAETISNKLSYYNELDRISSKLGSPTLAVTNESFVPMLSRLDECILYLRNNPQYKESHVYLARLNQCLTRALALIKTHVSNILQSSCQQIVEKKDTANLGDNAFTLFYGKFRANAPRVKALMEQLEIRIDKSPDYNQTLMDCQQTYFTMRETLLGPSIESTINDLASKHVRDHCALMRSGCAFMVHVCEDEYQLFYNFFTRHSEFLDQMLERLCNNLYDVFRPLIIHINHLETLAELCSIMKVEMLEEHVQNNVQELAAFELICKQMLMDMQERLVYRTYIYIRSDILNYSAAQGDLAYPEKLEMMQSISESIKAGQDRSRTSSVSSVQGHSRSPSNASSTSQEVAQLTDIQQQSEIRSSDSAVQIGSSMPMSPADLHGMWYPTVRRTLVTLSKLYRCIDKTTFQGLSQEALQSCIESLKSAKDGITKRKAALDGQLFLVKHLLILREQIAPFQTDFSIRETALDFSKLKDAARGLLHHKSNLFAFSTNNSLLQFILEGTPQVTEHFVDSKKDVDHQLKVICEEFIHHVSGIFTESLKTYLSRASVILSMKDEEDIKGVTLRQQPFATPEKLHDVVAETYKTIKTKLPHIHKSMQLYLANKDTEVILFKPIKVNIQQSFQQLGQILQEHYTDEDKQIVASPSVEQINLLLSTTRK